MSKMRLRPAQLYSRSYDALQPS